MMHTGQRYTPNDVPSPCGAKFSPAHQAFGRPEVPFEGSARLIAVHVEGSERNTAAFCMFMTSFIMAL